MTNTVASFEDCFMLNLAAQEFMQTGLGASKISVPVLMEILLLLST